ncbi:unnamed protein product [Rhizopus stolonifer]
METSYITIYDDTALAKYLFVSEGIQEALGYTPSELAQTEGYSLTHPDERSALRVIHNYSNMSNQGHYVTLDALLFWCHDIVVATTFVPNEQQSTRSARAYSADEFFVIENGEIQSSTQIPHVQWPTTPHEPRFCLILNWYSEQSPIVFATSLCEDMVGLNQLAGVGRSLFDFVAAEDQAMVRDQLELSKAHGRVVKVKFSWLVPEMPPILLEAVLSCTSDGLVMLLRRADAIYHNKIPHME